MQVEVGDVVKFIWGHDLIGKVGTVTEIGPHRNPYYPNPKRNLKHHNKPLIHVKMEVSGDMIHVDPDNAKSWIANVSTIINRRKKIIDAI